VWHSSGKWHGGGVAVDGQTPLATYASDTFSASPTDWAFDERPLFDAHRDAPTWPGMPCFCPDFFPADPAGPSSPNASAAPVWALKLSSGGRPAHSAPPPDYFLLGDYDGRARFAPHITSAGGVARLFPVDYGMVCAGTTMWDPTERRRIYFSWIGANNTHAFPREVLVRGSTILFRPIGEALNLRRPNASVAAAYSLRAPQLALNPVPLPLGLQQIDIEAEFSLIGHPWRSWEAWSAAAANCSLGVELRRGTAAAPIRVAVHNERSARASARNWRQELGLATPRAILSEWRGRIGPLRDSHHASARGSLRPAN
jgi:hypothetical protein